MQEDESLQSVLFHWHKINHATCNIPISWEGEEDLNELFNDGMMINLGLSIFSQSLKLNRLMGLVGLNCRWGAPAGTLDCFMFNRSDQIRSDHSLSFCFELPFLSSWMYWILWFLSVFCRRLQLTQSNPTNHLFWHYSWNHADDISCRFSPLSLSLHKDSLVRK